MKTEECNCTYSNEQKKIIKENCICSSCINDFKTKVCCSHSKSLPIRTQRLIECKEFENNQTMYKSKQIFTITNGSNFIDGEPICIDKISIGYNCLGIPLPLPYILGNNKKTFDISFDTSCNCTVNRIPDTALDRINVALYYATVVEAISQSVTNATTVEDKRTDAYLLSATAGYAANFTATAVQYLISLFIASSPNVSTDFLNALSNSAQAAVYLSFAVARLGEIVSDSSNVQVSDKNFIVGALNDFIFSVQNTANDIINATDPSAPADAIMFANIALNSISILNNYISDANTQGTFITLLRAVSWASISIMANIYNAVNELLSVVVNNDYISLVNSLGYTVGAILSANEVTSSTFDSLSFYNPLIPLARSALSGENTATAIREALNYKNNVEIVKLFTEFSTTERNNICCTHSDYVKEMFYQAIENFNVCGLVVYVEGKIGCNPFKAKREFGHLLDLSDLGYSSTDIFTKICHPNNEKKYILSEDFDPYLYIKCVLPNEPYNNINSANFTADIFFGFNLKTRISTSLLEQMIVFGKELNN